MKRTGRVMFCIVALVMVWLAIGFAAVEERHHDVVVVGAGVSGLAAIWELARSGIDVAVIEMSPSYGGAALLSEGRICIIDIPEQAQAGMNDSPQIAFEDFMEFGRGEGDSGPNAEWVHYYVTESRREIYDWLTGLEVRFEKEVGLMAGNRVPRWHQVIGKGRGLVDPIYRECTRTGNVTFFWNTRAVLLLRDSDHIRGVRAEQLRDGTKIDYLAPVVILATGGFQSNMNMVREYWPTGLPFPERLLIGAGVNAIGSGHDMAQAVSAQLKNMSNQWNYANGLPDPQDESGRRGLNAFSQQSIWVSKEGRRFVSESQDTRATFAEVLRQPGGTYWSIFDSFARGTFFVSGWDLQMIESKIFDNPAL